MVASYVAETVHPWTALGSRIADLRRRAGLSQRALAQAVHISEGYVPRIEKGINRPDPTILRRIAERTGGDYAELAALAKFADKPERIDDLDRAIDETWEEYDELARRTTEAAKKLRDLIRRRGSGPRPA